MVFIKMKVSIKRIDKSISLPEVKNSEMILTCRKDTVINSKDEGLVPTNLIIKPSGGYALTIIPADIFTNKGLMISEKTILDSTAPKEELKLSVFNSLPERAIILKGQIIAVGILLKQEKIILTEEK